MNGPELRVDITVDPSVADEVPGDCTDAAITAAVRVAAASQGFHRGEIGVRLTGDDEIHRINARHLGHDYPTDVISFGYDAESPRLEGELVLSVQTASANAAEWGRFVTEEILLYVVHGTLHIAGLDDADPDSIARMRFHETSVMRDLAALGFHPVAEVLGRRPAGSSHGGGSVL